MLAAVEIGKRTLSAKRIWCNAKLIMRKVSRILIADDESDILASYKEALERANHKVTTTKDGRKCLEAYYQEYKKLQSETGDLNGISPFDVVVLDYKMPKKNGLEAAKEILSLNPSQRIIFASAYVNDTIVDSIKVLGKIIEVIKKPFPLSEFVDQIENKKIFSELERLNVNIKNLKEIQPTHQSLRTYLETLKVLEKGVTH